MIIDRETGKKQTVTIEKIVSGGEGLFHDPNGVVGFVSAVLPGELVEVEIHPGTSRPLRATLVRVIQPSPDRTEPQCPVFGRCGGCDWQFINYHRQLALKGEILLENLRRLGRVDTAGIAVHAESGDPWGYRSRVQVHRSEEGRWGFRERRSHRVVPVDSCPIATKQINLSIAALNRELPSAERVTLVEDDHGVCRGDIGGEAQRTIAGRVLTFHPGSFFQSNVPLLDRLTGILRADAAERSDHLLLDLYAGAGVLAALAVKEGQKVIAVERDRRNADLIRRNLTGNGVPGANITVFADTAEARLNRLLPIGSDHETPSATVILDPPRKGLSRQVRSWLLERTFSRLAYLSCDSAALARDLGELTSVYPIRTIHLLDFYPQTAQIETLVLLGGAD